MPSGANKPRHARRVRNLTLARKHPDKLGFVLTMCILLWANEGCRDDLTAYEDQVLLIVQEHAGTVVSRLRTIPSDNGPDEIQVLQFPHDDALANYLADPRRTALAAERLLRRRPHRTLRRTAPTASRVTPSEPREPIGSHQAPPSSRQATVRPERLPPLRKKSQTHWEVPMEPPKPQLRRRVSDRTRCRDGR